jgi:hypothetical protein
MAGLLTYSIRKRLPIILQKNNSGKSVCFRTFRGVHSSGSVRDLHPIPFYRLFLHKNKRTYHGAKVHVFFISAIFLQKKLLSNCQASNKYINYFDCKGTIIKYFFFSKIPINRD